MIEPAAMQADYTDLRFIKGRKVIQVVLELPIEAGAQFVSMFGTPDPSKTIPVGIARIDLNAKPEKPKGGKLAQRAGILCNEKGFWVFLKEHPNHGPMIVAIESEKDAAGIIYDICDIVSRAELDYDLEAAAKFKDLEASYRAWLTVAA
jgi:hypothetical protein